MLLREIITEDERCVYYVNHIKKRKWLLAGESPSPEVKPGFSEIIILLLLWVKFLRYALLRATTQWYCSDANQLQKLADILSKRYPMKMRFVFQPDNERPHVAKITEDKIKELVPVEGLRKDLLNEKAIKFVRDNAKVTTARKPRAKKEDAEKTDAE